MLARLALNNGNPALLFGCLPNCFNNREFLNHSEIKAVHRLADISLGALPIVAFCFKLIAILHLGAAFFYA